MRRALCLYLPTWATDLVRRRVRRLSPCAERPEFILLACVSGQKQVVAHGCARACSVGVRPGMTVAHARALLPTGGVRVEPDRPARSLAALRALASWASRFSPVVAPDPPDGLLMDITGCAHLFGDEQGLAGRLRWWMRTRGFAARIAVAPTYGCAWGVARFGGRDLVVVPDEGSRCAMEPLPVRALRIDGATEAAMREVGIERVEHLLAVPRAELPSRFGSHPLQRLDQAMGLRAEMIDPVRPVEPTRAVRVFDGPTEHHESIEAAALAVLGDLCRELSARRQGVSLLRMELARPGSEAAVIEIPLSRPVHDAGHLWSLLRTRLERVHAGFGVEGVALTAVRTARLRHEQPGFVPQGEAHFVPNRGCDAPCVPGPRAAELIDTLLNRLGPSRIARARAVESHIPERGHRLLPITEPRTPAAGPAASAVADRPSFLLNPPEAARVVALAPDGPLLRLSWRSIESAVLSCLGPERIEPEWWRDDRLRAARDWFKVQDETGRWFWLFREVASGRWFVHGLWA